MTWSTPFVIATIAAPAVALAQAPSPKSCLPGKTQLDIGRAQAMARTRPSTPPVIDWSKSPMSPVAKAPAIAAARAVPDKLMPCAQTPSTVAPK